MVTLSRASRAEELHFELMGGHEIECGIFVDRVSDIKLNILILLDVLANFESIGIYFNFIPIHLQVEKGSKAAKAGLKRGDQVLEVNSRDFEKGMPLQKAQTILMETTHIQFTVRSNLLGKYCLATILPNAITLLL